MYNCVVLHPFNSFTGIIMLTWLYELLMTFVTCILGLFGIQMNKKSVSFAEELEQRPTPEVVDNTNVVDSNTQTE